MKRKVEKIGHRSKKIIMRSLVVLCLIALLIPHHIRVLHSAKLIEVIQTDDIVTVKEIIEKDPKCVNCPPVWFPKLNYCLESYLGVVRKSISGHRKMIVI